MSDPSASSTYGVPPSDRDPIPNNNNNMGNINTGYTNRPSTGGATTSERPPTSGMGKFNRFVDIFRGAFEATHGLGESIRGTALGAIDNAFNTNQNHNEPRSGSGAGSGRDNDEIVRRGKLEMQQGLAKLRGISGNGSGAQPPVQSGINDYDYDSGYYGGNSNSASGAGVEVGNGGSTNITPSYPTSTIATGSLSGRTNFYRSVNEEYNKGEKFGTGTRAQFPGNSNSTAISTTTTHGTAYQLPPPPPPPRHRLPRVLGSQEEDEK